MWLFFAVLAPMFWALSNPIDAGLRREHIKNDYVLTWAFALTKLPIAIALAIIFFNGIPLNINFIWMFLAGIIWTLPFILYYKALKLEEPSRVILILQTMPVFVLIFAAILIGEKLSLNQMVAFALILSGGMIAAIIKTDKKWHLSKALLMALFAAVLWGLSDVIFKASAVYFSNFYSAFAVNILGASLPTLIIFLLPKREKFFTDFRALKAKWWILFAVSSLVGTLGSISFSYALTLGPAALTSVICGLQPFFALILGRILSKFFKEIPKESLSKSDIIVKLTSFTIILGGLAYLNFA